MRSAPDLTITTLGMLTLLSCAPRTGHDCFPPEVQARAADRAIQQGLRILAAKPDDGATHYFMALAYLMKCGALAPTDTAYTDSSSVWLDATFRHSQAAMRLAPADYGQDAVDVQFQACRRYYKRGLAASHEADPSRMLSEYGLAVTAILGAGWETDSNSDAVIQTLAEIEKYRVSASQMAAFHHAWAEVLYSAGRVAESCDHFRAAAAAAAEAEDEAKRKH